MVQSHVLKEVLVEELSMQGVSRGSPDDVSGYDRIA